ncbi:MAG: hypothetical protein WKG06_41435 [Segetibacter sp.]
MVVNTEGFIKYSSVLQGNIADCKTLSAMIEKLSITHLWWWCSGGARCRHCHRRKYSS